MFFDALTFVHVRRSGQTTSLRLEIPILLTVLQRFRPGKLQIYQGKRFEQRLFSMETLKRSGHKVKFEVRGNLLYSGLRYWYPPGLSGDSTHVALRTVTCGCVTKGGNGDFR